ncbi:hypothetical protein ES703_95009 [subsurface metagenome]
MILKLDMNLNIVAIGKYDARISDRVKLRIQGNYLYCTSEKAGGEPLATMGILLKINKFDLSISGQFGYGGDAYNKNDVWSGLWVDDFYAYLVGKAVTNPEDGAWVVKVNTTTMTMADEAAYIFTPSRTGEFFDVVGDSLNLYCVGGYYDASYNELGAIVKISKATLNVVTQKPYGSIIPPASYFNNEFYGVQIDDNYVYVVGYCDGNEAFGAWSGLLVKLNKSDLSFVARTVLGGIGSDYTWHEAVDVDANNIFVVGVTKAKGPGNYSGLITKWDMDLSISRGAEDFKAKQSVQGVGAGLTKDAHSLTGHAPGVGPVGVTYTYNDSNLTLSSLELILDGFPLTAPTVATDPAVNIKKDSASLAGELSDDGGEACDCGFEWGETEAYGNTTPTESKTTGESFSQPLTGLSSGTTYHFRAFATNSGGTGYGADRTFNTLFVCPYCGAAGGTFDTQEELDVHIDSEHPSVPYSRAYALSREEL